MDDHAAARGDRRADGHAIEQDGDQPPGYGDDIAHGGSGIGPAFPRERREIAASSMRIAQRSPSGIRCTISRPRPAANICRFPAAGKRAVAFHLPGFPGGKPGNSPLIVEETGDFCGIPQKSWARRRDALHCKGDGSPGGGRRPRARFDLSDHCRDAGAVRRQHARGWSRLRAALAV